MKKLVGDTNILTCFEGMTPLGDPPKTNSLNDLIYGASVFSDQK